MRNTASEVRETAIRAGRAGRATALRAARRVRQHWRTASPAQRQAVRLTASSAALGLVVAGAAVTAAGPWDSGQRTAERNRAVGQHGLSGTKHTGGGSVRPPEVLTALGNRSGGRGASGGSADAVPPPSPAALADVLEPLLKDGKLGTVRTASVLDPASGRELYQRGGGTPSTPASVTKLATGTAALSARGAEHRIATRTVRDGGKVVLVGGGDPTLDGKGLGKLAADTARRLAGSGTEKVSLGYDTSGYAGPEQHPEGSGENLAPVSPLMVDQGRRDSSDHGPAPRSANPAKDAAQSFAQQLEKRGVHVSGKPGKRAPGKDAKPLAAHHSAPLSSLVERMLTDSDNDIAEALARQAALGTGHEPSFSGGGAAVRQRLDALKLPLHGVHFADGSGLDRDDRVTSRLLSRLLALAGAPEHPQLRPVLTGLPVAHFTGTLEKRYGDEKGKPGAGLVRAKTGTLTGVNSLAGSTVDADGRMLTFAFLTSGAPDRHAAQQALDAVASALANCGCQDSPSTG